jgi:Peptidase_C39 like family
VQHLAVVGLAVPALLLGAPAAWAGGPAGTAADTVASGQEQSTVVGNPTLTARQRASAAAKDAAVARITSDQRTSARGRGSSRAAEALPTHRSIKSIKQKAQSRSYWCGPATLAMLVRADDRSISQKTAAKRLHTTSDGTNWYNGGGVYPMEKALEHYTDGFDYTAQNLAFTPSKKDKQKFQDRLVTDIAVHKQGIAGNAVEVTNGPHLKGHPNRTIYHWVAVRGYDDEGETTRYADSVSGSNISWSAPVPRYSEIDTDKIVTIFGARGYVW